MVLCNPCLQCKAYIDRSVGPPRSTAHHSSQQVSKPRLHCLLNCCSALWQCCYDQLVVWTGHNQTHKDNRVHAQKAIVLLHTFGISFCITALFPCHCTAPWCNGDTKLALPINVSGSLCFCLQACLWHVTCSCGEHSFSIELHLCITWCGGRNCSPSHQLLCSIDCPFGCKLDSHSQCNSELQPLCSMLHFMTACASALTCYVNTMLRHDGHEQGCFIR